MSADGGGPAKIPRERQLCDATEVCAKCGAMAAPSKCSRCLRVCYCTKQCQEKHWPIHRKICKTPAQQETGAGQQEDRNIDLFNASFDGDMPTVTALIAEGADVNWADFEQALLTQLHAASQRGHLSVVNALIAARAVVDRVNAGGFTALMMAAQEGHEAVVSALHRVAGASVHHVNNQGFTAMHMATQNGHLVVVRVLLRARDNPNVLTADGNGSSPLTLASQDGHLAVVQALIEAGANVNYSRPDGVTSLMMAAQDGYIEVVRALLAANADPRIVAHDGATALDDAKRNNHTAIIALLEARLTELAAFVSGSA